MASKAFPERVHTPGQREGRNKERPRTTPATVVSPAIGEARRRIQSSRQHDAGKPGGDKLARGGCGAEKTGSVLYGLARPSFDHWRTGQNHARAAR
jgi:hypothetical protein